MALIFEFKAKQSPIRKPLPASAAGTGSVVFFTGIRYERIAPADMAAAAKAVVSRKRTGPRRARSIEALA
jgi:hypothetical protein